MLAKQACLDPVSEFGMDVKMPNRMAINASKFTYASNFHTMCQHMHDIGGGLTTTVPAYRDWKNEEIGPYAHFVVVGRRWKTGAGHSGI